MTTPGLNTRFLQTTRGKIVAALRRGAGTVEELARSLGLTDNAVRAHLSTLERDGLVRAEGVRRGPGAGKPATLYEVPRDVEPLFSRAYAPVLGALLDELAEQLPAERRVDVMRAVGRRLAAGVGRPTGEPLEARAQAAVALLNALGGDAQLEEHEDRLVIRGCGCPLSAATSRRPEVCRAVEALLTEVVGSPIKECCAHGDRPRCCFDVLAEDYQRNPPTAA
ncbi:MAG TPA: ArsR family transcriptional regulator [Gemmatimonadaceae bacterium]|nr:ArsR family transcriptional regulator [Gemmatimonadaceae bacterium]